MIKSKKGQGYNIEDDWRMLTNRNAIDATGDFFV